MTGSTTFGDLADAASTALGQAVILADPARTGWAARRTTAYSGEIEHAVTSLVRVLGRYLDDISAVAAADQPRRLPEVWDRACERAREELETASGPLGLSSSRGATHLARQPESPLGRSLRSAAAALTADRDLLNTHWRAGPDGAWSGCSEWVPVLTSASASTALLLDVGRWARLTEICATHAASIRLPEERSTGDSGLPLDAQHRLQAASGWLRKVHQLIGAAQHTRPASAADIRLLHAIPVNELPDRRLPDGRENLGDLRQGVVNSAERVRHLAFTSEPDQRWPPDLTASALRETAACATAISHHCSIILHTLAAHPAVHDPALRESLTRSAVRAEQSRYAWLKAAWSWDSFASQDHADASPLQAGASDLALWTGRLAYGDTGWTLADGPTRPARPPASLAPEPEDIPGIVAAAHQACESVAQLAVASERHIRLGIETDSFYVPSDSLPHLRSPQPFTPAPPLRLVPVAAAHKQARQASIRTVASVAENSLATRAPTTILAIARAATRAPGTNLRANGDLEIEHRADREVRPQPSGQPGHFEQILSRLGETDPEALKRAAAIDQAGEQLIIERAHTVKLTDLASEISEATRSRGIAERMPSRQPARTNRRTWTRAGRGARARS